MTDKETSKRATARINQEKTSPAQKSQQSAWAWPDFTGAAGAQFGGVKTLSEVSTLFVRTAQDLAARQAAFMKANAETVQNAAGLYSETDPAKRLARQGDLYREMMERSADHISTVAAAISGYCCEAMEQMTDAATKSMDTATQKNAPQDLQK